MTNKKHLLKIWQICVIILLNILIITLAASHSVEALSKMGSTGPEVREIQTRLKNGAITTETWMAYTVPPPKMP